MNFKISETNKNVVIFYNDKKEYPVVIPPTNGKRIDFIDRNLSIIMIIKESCLMGILLK